MKRIFFFCLLTFQLSFCYAQYSKEKLIGILSGGSSKAWTVKSTTASHSEKSYTFNNNLTVGINNDKGSPKVEKWLISSTDNIRWFITIKDQKYELIVSYDKSGTQYLKLTNAAGEKAPVNAEMDLYPVK